MALPKNMARWSLADLIDFETWLAREGDTAGSGGERLRFIRDIRPRLTTIDDELTRRRVGLRLWLDQRRENNPARAGQMWQHGLALAHLLVFVVLALAGAGLVTGLVLGPRQAVHVIVFFGLTLVLPWALFAAFALARRLGASRAGWLRALMDAALRLSGRDAQRARDAQLFAALTQGRHARRALAATLAGVSQRGAVGFNLGLVLAFAGCLMLFDVRFYWEATPRAGIDAALSALTQAVAVPWSWAWPGAVPTPDEIVASRAGVGSGTSGVALGRAANWWPFLLMSLLVWGLVPRLLLAALYDGLARRALARLDFQAPRHRALWRRLNAIERGETAAGPTDGVLALDVGGHGVTGEAVRGFLLRRLRVNPLHTRRVAVLDENDEARAEHALAAGPAGVVLLAEAWALSPRQVDALHGRLRAALGAATPMIWVVFALEDGRPCAPADSDMQRWTRQIDSLCDPATEVAAYAAGA